MMRVIDPASTDSNTSIIFIPYGCNSVAYRELEIEFHRIARRTRVEEESCAKVGSFLGRQGRSKTRASETGQQHGCATRPTGRIDSIHPVAPVPRTEIVTCPLRRRDSNAHGCIGPGHPERREEKTERVPWRGSSEQLSSTRNTLSFINIRTIVNSITDVTQKSNN